LYKFAAIDAEMIRLAAVADTLDPAPRVIRPEISITVTSPTWRVFNITGIRNFIDAWTQLAAWNVNCGVAPAWISVTPAAFSAVIVTFMAV
jgi:hypothetical protein